MIYIDRLSLKSCFLSLKLIYRKGGYDSKKSIQVLDPISSGLLSILLVYMMRLFSVKVCESKFNAGQLYTRDGKNVYLESQILLDKVSYNAARKIVRHSKPLYDLNKKWKRNTILLSIYKYLKNSASCDKKGIVLKILIANSLSWENKDRKNCLILELPSYYSIDDIKSIEKTVKLYFYSTGTIFTLRSRLTAALFVVYSYSNNIVSTLLFKLLPKPNLGNTTLPTLLTLQEDDLSLDRSYRGQPHWVFKEGGVPQFRTLVLPTETGFTEFNKEELNKYNIYLLPKKILSIRSEKHKIHKKIIKSIYLLFRHLFFDMKVSREIFFELVLLHIKSLSLANLCVNQDVKIFMTCENYFRDSDAMNMIGESLNIGTLSYQYSNMDTILAPMLTTVDTMYTFSTLFQNRWRKENLGPKSFVNVGYIYDSSFKSLNFRANKIRKKLKEKGADFVITYLDENIQNSKYSLIDRTCHYEELLPLIELVLSDNSIAVVIKCQFQRNTPSVLYKESHVLEKARKTGRWYEMGVGILRNNIFPAEAAILSDFVIGHTVGASAGLESALVGSRCILLNPYKMSGDNIDIFKQAKILYNNMDSALDAISAFRKDQSKYQDLGDWSSILDQFDAYQDGYSATRMRKNIEQKLSV